MSFSARQSASPSKPRLSFRSVLFSGGLALLLFASSGSPGNSSLVLCPIPQLVELYFYYYNKSASLAASTQTKKPMSARNILPGTRGLRGHFPSKKAGKSLPFESRLERDHLLLLEADPAVASLAAQPVTISFTEKARSRRYTPDCRVDYRSAAIVLVEVKYQEELASYSDEQRAATQESHDAARAYCLERNWAFELRTDADIIGPALDRARALFAFARAPALLNEHSARIESTVARRPGITLAELVGELGAKSVNTELRSRHQRPSICKGDLGRMPKRAFRGGWASGEVGGRTRRTLQIYCWEARLERGVGGFFVERECASPLFCIWSVRTACVECSICCWGWGGRTRIPLREACVLAHQRNEL